MTNPFLRPPAQGSPPPLSRDALQAARTSAMAEVTQIHAETQEQTAPLEELVSAARQAKTAKEDAAAEYDRIRAELWKAMKGKIGAKIGTTTAKFGAPMKGRRSVNYGRLAEEFPEAYEATVTEPADPDPNAPGRLYL